MKQLYEKLKPYPIVILFFAFLIGFSALDMMWPKREASYLENRKLAQMPEFSVSQVLNGRWMVDYDKYVKDQFAFRDTWINMKSRSETMLLKTENNNILFGTQDYLFPKEFTFNEKNFTKNLGAVQKWAERHPGEIDVMIVPSASFILNNYLPAAAPMIDEGVHLDTIVQTLSPTATVYDLRDALTEHRNEYIYYRTDHHWTAQGAHIAYESYVRSKEKNVFDAEASAKVDVPEFYGTSYSSARNANVVPDVLTYYQLQNTMDIHTIGTTGLTTVETTGLYDLEKLTTRDMYAMFLHGNNSFSSISGNGTGRILVIKDSYANSFIPYLTASYETIDVVDFRLNLNKIDVIMEQGNYDDILFLYSFDAFTEDLSFASRIATP